VKVPTSAFAPSFVLKSGKTATETYQLLQQAYGEAAMGRTQVFDWFRRFNLYPTNAYGIQFSFRAHGTVFKLDSPALKANPRSGRPSTSRSEEMIAKVRTIVRNNRRLTVREIADDCGISVGSCNAENDRKNGGMATQSCSTTMRPQTLHILCSRFWPNTAPLSCSSRHTHQISHRVNFSCSQGLRKF